MKSSIYKTKQRVKLDDWQIKFLETKGDKLLCTGRQIGKTEICAIDACEYAVANPHSKPIVMIAPTERQARALYQKTLTELLTNYPKLIITKGKLKPTQEKINLTNGVEIYCLPVGATGLSIRFITIGRLYIDEASRMPDMVYEAVYPALLTTGADTIMISTPYGAQGEFWKTAINKDSAYDSFTRFFMSSEKVINERPISDTWSEFQRERSLRRLDRDKKRMSKKQYAQEYLGEFVDDLYRWFSDELIKQVCVLKRDGIIRKKANNFMGVDLARMGDDEIVYSICERTKDMIYQKENRIMTKKYTTETEDEIRYLNEIWNLKKIYIDAGAGTIGVSIFDHLIKDDKLSKRVVAINNAKRIIEYSRTGEPKYVYLLKEDLYDNLRALMEQNKIKLLDDEEIIESLTSVQYEYVKKEGQPTKLRIFGNYTHIAEALVRMAWCVKERLINFQIYYI